MEKITFSELTEAFYKHNEVNNASFVNKNILTGVIVFKNGPWFKKEFTEIERSYSFSSNNKFFVPCMCGNSIFADCLDNTEHGIRLDAYFGKWEIDYCYIKEN